ncbi:unnamed protein product [Rangifer tarandus platyrhynchus]|uniref:Uncharacterized protein n=1 Tax=Rangifer tarandus platyrhynchus TaxID=3082113 RepID=A0AC59ZAH6_RANTA
MHKKAFDRVQDPFVIKKLNKLSIEGTYHNIIKTVYGKIVIPFPSSCYCSVAQSCLTLCDLVDCSTPGLSVLHHLPESAQAHVHCISDAIQPSHTLRPSSPSALHLSQHQGLFQ